MEIKYSIQGLLIYWALVGYFFSFVLSVCGQKRLGTRFFLLSFIIALSAMVCRVYDVRQVPLQTLFEVFLFLGVIIYPVSKLSEKYLVAGFEKVDMLIGFILLFPCGFVFHSQPQQLPPALQSHFFAPHVAAYMFAYILLTKAAFVSLSGYFKEKDIEQEAAEYDRAAYQMTRIGFPLLVLGLLLGSMWAKMAWGYFWGWDPKELWSLATMLVYLLYYHIRLTNIPRARLLNTALLTLGFIFIVITLLWVNLSNIFSGLHNYAS